MYVDGLRQVSHDVVASKIHRQFSRPHMQMQSRIPSISAQPSLTILPHDIQNISSRITYDIQKWTGLELRRILET